MHMACIINVFGRIKESLWNKSSILINYIDMRTPLNQFEMVISSFIHERTLKNVLFYKKTVLIENHVNRESKSLELTI